MGPVVVVEVPRAPPGYADTLVRACSQASTRGPCERARAVPRGTGRIVAVVSFTDDRLRAQIDLALSGRHDSTLRREIDFDAATDEKERFRSVGLTIATMVDALDEERQGAGSGGAGSSGGALGSARDANRSGAETDDAAADVSHGAAGNVREARARARVTLDGAALLGPGLDPGGWKLGGLLRAAYRPGRAPLLISGFGSYARRREDQHGLGAAWATLGLGGAYQLSPVDRLTFRLRLELVAQAFTARVDDRETGATDHGAVFDVGGVLGADLAYALAPWIGILAGVDVTTTARSLQVRLGGEPFGRGDALTYTLFAGARFTLSSDGP